MDTVRVEIIPNKELFRDDNTGFKIYSADVKDSNADIEVNNYGNISLKGNNLPDFNLGSVYDLELARNTKDKYKGSYTMVKSYFVKPQSPEDQWKFLSMVVTELQFESISRHYLVDVDKIIDIILEGEFQYENINGYGEVTYIILKDKIRDDLNVSEALAYFSEYEISYNTIKRMVMIYGSSEKAIEEIEKNPYAIIEKDGFGFLKADDLAMKLGIDAESPHRIKSCMIYVLEDINNNGDIWIEKKKLYNKMKKMLKINKESIQEIMEQEHSEVFVWNDRYSTSSSAKNELSLSFMIADKVLREENPLSEKGYNPTEFIQSFEEKNNMTLSSKQNEFLNRLGETNVLFLVGNAGSGKSLLQKIVVDVADAYGLSITLLAPTGRASKVLTTYTGRKAHTIHKKVGFGKGEEAKIMEDIILVDEASMCDIKLARQFMSAVKENSIVVFIGDDAQIPSVGEGNFLFDCINFSEMPVVKLDKVFRQKESGLLDAITMTRKGKAFLNTHSVKSQRIGNNFEFRHMIKEQVLGNLIDSYKKLIKSGYGYEEIAIVVPTNIGEIGTVNVNNSIQEIINPQSEVEPKDEFVFGNKDNQRIIRVGDYVMNTENMYDAPVVNKAERIDVFNGETGVVIAVNLGSKDVIIDFEGNHVLYAFTEATKKLSHAWAITVHKAQGSQYDVVLAVVDSSATYQLNANLLYTATSRTKKFLGVFGQAQTYNKAIRKFANFDRQSFLGEFLEISFQLHKAQSDTEKIELEDIKNLGSVSNRT